MDQIRYTPFNQFPEEVWFDSDPSEEKEEQYQRLIDHYTQQEPSIEPASITRSSDQSTEEPVER